MREKNSINPKGIESDAQSLLALHWPSIYPITKLRLIGQQMAMFPW